MKNILAERNIVILLFIIVIVVFSFAEKASRRYEKAYLTGELLQKINSLPATVVTAHHSIANNN